MSLPPKLQQTLDDLALFPDRSGRIEHLIEIADDYRPAPVDEFPRPNPEENRVPGCESEVFVYTLLDKNNRLRLEFAVENPQGISAMALAAILKDALDGEPIQTLDQVPEDLPYLVFGRELSMGKSMGLTNLVRLIKSQATKLA